MLVVDLTVIRLNSLVAVRPAPTIRGYDRGLVLVVVELRGYPSRNEKCEHRFRELLSIRACVAVGLKISIA